MEDEKYNHLLQKINELMTQLNILSEKVRQHSAEYNISKLKRKWRADIKKELEVYTHNSYASDMDEYKEVEYSD